MNNNRETFENELYRLFNWGRQPKEVSVKERAALKKKIDSAGKLGELHRLTSQDVTEIFITGGWIDLD